MSEFGLDNASTGDWVRIGNGSFLLSLNGVVAASWTEDVREVSVESMGKIVAVSTGKCVEPEWAARRGRSAIEKLSVDTSVAVTKLGIEGDEQAADFHGGALQAVYAYAREDLDWWSEQLGRPLRNGMFGENLDLLDFDVTGAVLAERWRVGEVLFEVMAPRMACGTFGAWMAEQGWAKRFNGARRPGAYLRVVEEGRLAPGDPVEVVWRPALRVTMADSVGAILGDKDAVRRISALSAETPHWDPEAMMFHIERRYKKTAGAGALASQSSASGVG
jgi:MOSC domain-containing protein YiiM